MALARDRSQLGSESWDASFVSRTLLLDHLHQSLILLAQNGRIPYAGASGQNVEAHMVVHTSRNPSKAVSPLWPPI